MNNHFPLRLFRGGICLLAAFFTPAQTHAQSNPPPGQQLFSACAACHGLDGRGGEHAPNIATEANIQQLPDDALLAIVRNGIPAKGMPGFSKLLDEKQLHAVVLYLRLLQGSGTAASLPGNPEKGRELFFGRAACADCHMVNGRGGFFAADLSAYGGHPAEEIRKAILSPDASQSPRRGTVTVVTRDDETYRGAIRNEDNFSLQMQTPDGKFHLFDKAELVRIDHESKSMMPADYGSKLTSAEIDNLIKYLSQSGGGKKPDADDDSQ